MFVYLVTIKKNNRKLFTFFFLSSQNKIQNGLNLSQKTIFLIAFKLIKSETNCSKNSTDNIK
ncbi:hypothetical protein BpHYR1_036317 [Brachionus plicatilis]|uniref:Uncharacterized protein n=1 Tax=Brachionus plicatilis TaxID=10195 RepID=A0A3M7SLR9_BRAPC|nr:hypothetical protein BpHYR1_036317 [Brachionus plicatilis]